MTHITNNGLESSEQPQESLSRWILSHTDPNKDPWTSQDWSWSDTEDSQLDLEDIPRDPTLGRESEEECVVVGSRDSEGRPEGNVSLSWTNGDTFKGCYVSGRRSGWGIVSSPTNNILALTGTWSDGWLQGKGRLVSGNIFCTFVQLMNIFLYICTIDEYFSLHLYN